jgi:FKBP-type peptidyl-prolyl cis-trans isomerase FkpA
MKNRFFSSAFAFAGLMSIILLASCDKKGGYKKTESGLRYKFHGEMQDTSKRAHPGEIITFHFTAKNSKDSMFINSYEKNAPATIPLFPPTYKGCIFEGFAMMGKGDSATFVVNADSLYTNTFRSERPAFLAPGSDVTFTIKMVDVVTQQQMEERSQKERMEKLEKEVIDMENWLGAKGLKATTLQSGVKVVITKKTNGQQVKAGDEVEVFYTGRFLDGTEFDGNVGKTPMTAKLEEGSIIPGWIDGLSQMKEGEKATILIPFDRGYGAQGSRNVIPPYATLVFDVEIVKIKK